MRTMSKPTYGHTKTGRPVHAKTADYHRADTAYARFNKTVAIWLVQHVFTMTCFWIFCILSFLVLPSVFYAMGILTWKVVFTSFGFELAMTWLLSTFIQLVLLPAIGVGQNLQAVAADARSEKTFEDAQLIADRLDTSTKGGITDVLDRLDQLEKNISVSRKR